MQLYSEFTALLHVHHGITGDWYISFIKIRGVILDPWSCLLWIDKARGTDKIYPWMSVRWKTKWWVSVWLDVMGATSKLSVIRKDAAFVRARTTLILNFCCLLWINKERVKDKTYIWVSVRWKTWTKNEESTRLLDTGLVLELGHLKTKTRLKDEKFASVKGECET